MTTSSSKNSMLVMPHSHNWYIRHIFVMCRYLARRGNSALVRVQDMSDYRRWSIHVTHTTVITRTYIVEPGCSLPCSQQPPLVPIHGQINPVHAVTTDVFTIHISVTRSLQFRSPLQPYKHLPSPITFHSPAQESGPL